MAADGTLEIRPRTTGEILDDAWRLALANGPALLLLDGLFLVPAFAALLLVLTRPRPESFLARGGLPALAALLVALTGLGSGSCQELFRARAERRPVSVTGCLGGALRHGLEHVAARSLVLAGILVGTVCLVMPGLTLWMATTSVHSLIAAGKGRSWAGVQELGREARFAPGKTAAVILSRLPLLLIAYLNLLLLTAAALWVAGTLGGFDTALLDFVLSWRNPVFSTALVMLGWLLLSPYFEASNFLLHSDTRTRQEGLDLLYRVQRAFPLLEKRGAVVLIALGAALLFGAGRARAEESPRDAVRAVRAGVERVLGEVEAADPYPGGGRWEPELESLGRRLEAAGGGGANRFRWFKDAVDGFGRRNRSDAIGVLKTLRQRLTLLEDTLARPRREPAEGDRPRLSREEVKKLLRREGVERKREPGRSGEANRQDESRRDEVRRDEPEQKSGGGRRSASGAIAPAPAGGFGKVGWFLLTGLALAVLAVAAVLFVSRRGAAAARPAQKDEAAPAQAEKALPQPHEQPAAEWWRQAEGLAREGRYRDAVRSLYLAVLSLLHRRNLLRYEPTRTNGEYVRQVQLAPEAPPGLHVPFERLTKLFDARWYGERACEQGDYAECRELAEDVRSQVQ